MSQAVLTWDTLDPFSTTGLAAAGGPVVPAPAAGMPSGPNAPSAGGGNVFTSHLGASRPMFWGAVLIGLTFLAVGASSGHAHAGARESASLGPLHEEAGAGA